MAKKEEFIPADLVKKLYNEGRGETEVITQLRAQGFTPSQIDKAMKAVPKPRHAAVPEPAALPRKEEYRGPLPHEVIRPVAKAEAPAPRPFGSPLGGTMGAETEKIVIPRDLMPMGIPEHPAAERPAPAHVPVPAPVKEKPKEERPFPAPVPAAAMVAMQPAAVAGAPKISLEELTEQIVAEQEKKLYAHLDKLQSEHDANVKKIGEALEKLNMLSVDLRALQKTVDDKSAFAADANKELAVKIEAIETAFKELSHFMKKK